MLNWLLFGILACFAGPAQGQTSPQSPVVHAVFFFSPTCPHCEVVISNHLVPLQDRYDDSLIVLSLSIGTDDGNRLFQAAMERYLVPRTAWGVPFMIVGDEVMMGSEAIPSRLPALIEEGLASGGIDLPDFPALISFLDRLGALRTVEPGPRYLFRSPSSGSLPPARFGAWDRLARDKTGSTLAVLLLVGMVVALGGSLDPRKSPRRAWPSWLTPALSTAGLVVALYLSYVEMTGNPAVCGPIGDCNTVQQSSYATLLGVPIGLLGVATYVFILSLWLARCTAPQRVRNAAALMLWVVALLGTLFSAYLTFLEPFVIGAVCMWCLTSALVMTLLLLSSVAPAAQALDESMRRARGPALSA